MAEVLKHVVFAHAESAEGRALLADALEQMGYQAESGPWRNIYLQGAWELRHSLPHQAAKHPAHSDTVRNMTPEMIFDYMAVRLDGPKAAGKKLSINIYLSNTDEKYTLFLDNAVLNYTKTPWHKADLSLYLPKTALAVVLFDTSCQELNTLVQQKTVKIKGQTNALTTLMGLLDTPEFWFPIVTP